MASCTHPAGLSLTLTHGIGTQMTLMISPIFDLYSLKKQNVASAAGAGAHGAAAVGLGTSVGHESRRV